MLKKTLDWNVKKISALKKSMEWNGNQCWWKVWSEVRNVLKEKFLLILGQWIERLAISDQHNKHRGHVFTLPTLRLHQANEEEKMKLVDYKSDRSCYLASPGKQHLREQSIQHSLASQQRVVSCQFVCHRSHLSDRPNLHHGVLGSDSIKLSL